MMLPQPCFTVEMFFSKWWAILLVKELNFWLTFDPFLHVVFLQSLTGFHVEFSFNDYSLLAIPPQSEMWVFPIPLDCFPYSVTDFHLCHISIFNNGLNDVLWDAYFGISFLNNQTLTVFWPELVWKAPLFSWCFLGSKLGLSWICIESLRNYSCTQVDSNST